MGIRMISKPPAVTRRPWTQLVRLSCLHDVVVELVRGHTPARASCHLCRALEKRAEVLAGGSYAGLAERADEISGLEVSADAIARMRVGLSAIDFCAVLPAERLVAPKLRDGLEPILRNIFEPLVSVARDVALPGGSIDFLIGSRLAVDVRTDGTSEYVRGRLEALPLSYPVDRICLISTQLAHLNLPAVLSSLPVHVIVASEGEARNP